MVSSHQWLRHSAWGMRWYFLLMADTKESKANVERQECLLLMTDSKESKTKYFEPGSILGTGLGAWLGAGFRVISRREFLAVEYS